MGLRFSAMAAGALLAAATFATDASATSQKLGPVPAKVMAAVNHPTKLFSLRIGHLRAPTVSAHAAVRDAERSMPSVGPANGVSLVRTTKNSDPSHPGRVVWLVSIDVRHALLWHGPGPGHHVRHRQRANYVVVAVDPYSGKFVMADAGYDPKLTQRS